MCPLQLNWYKSIIEKDYANLEMLSGSQLSHLISQLWKVVNHPKQIYNRLAGERTQWDKRLNSAYFQGCEFAKFTNQFAEPAVGTLAWKRENELKTLSGEALVQASGKLAMLDRLLLRLKSRGSLVLLFTQYTETLDLLEEYCKFRFGTVDEVYTCLDGYSSSSPPPSASYFLLLHVPFVHSNFLFRQTNRILREINMRSFNAPDSKLFIFLISTKAGGVGLNLATADSVILYDSCWNPQVDLQAQDRAHRIGQKKQVTVYRLVTKDTFEERVLQMAERKMVLDQAVIAKGIPVQDVEDEELSVVAMSSLVGFGAAKIMNCSSTEGGTGTTTLY